MGCLGKSRWIGGITIGHYQYLALMAACLLITLPLELLLGARVYRRFRMLVLAVLPVVIIFSVWDVVGILRGHWEYNPAYVTGIRLVFGMPLEELVFFIVIPICGVLTYEAVGQVLRRGRGLLERRRPGRGAAGEHDQRAAAGSRAPGDAQAARGTQGPQDVRGAGAAGGGDA